jgi:RNA polymerase-binding transcription factor
VEEHRLRAIERALAKIDEGTYGLSDLSGDPIPKGRLEAMPEAVLTIQEEEARERQQRR